MAKDWLPFHPSEWARSTKDLPAHAKGFYIDLIAYAHNRGPLAYQIDAWRRIFGTFNQPVEHTLSGLSLLANHGLCKVSHREDGRIAITDIKWPRPAIVFPSNWRKLRSSILARDNYECRYCGNEADSVDHVTPRAHGGTHTEDNLVAACMPCNRHKQARTPEQWRANA